MIKILHLYPNLMNLYGDYGNVSVFVKHLNDQGLETSVDKKEVGDNINFANYDFVYMGSGNETNLMLALKDLMRYQDDIKKYVESNKVLFFTGNAMEVLGRTIHDKPALDIFHYDTKFTNQRYTGDAIVYDSEIGEVVGYINRSSITDGDTSKKFFFFKYVDKNLKENTFEGYRYLRCFGTHLIGPVLSKNPNLVKYLVHFFTKNIIEIEYPYEEKAHDFAIKQLKKKRK